MALTYITYKCGHTDNVQIYGTNVHGERDRKAAWYGTILCPDCRKVQDAAWCADNGCAPLTGSEKQIAWAESIRRPIIEGAEHYLEACKANGATAEAEAGVKVIEDLKARTSASQWIDDRNNPAYQQLINLGKQ